MNRFAALHMDRFGSCQNIDSKMNAKICTELEQMTECFMSQCIQVCHTPCV